MTTIPQTAQNGKKSQKPSLLDGSLHTYNGSVEMSDAGNATRLLDRHSKNLRYIPQLKRWLIWNGQYWQVDEQNAYMLFAEDTLRSIYSQAGATTKQADRKGMAKFAISCENVRRIKAMLEIASSRPGTPIKITDLDKDPMKFTVANGTIQLTTGKLEPHDRDDMISRQSEITYDANATCPEWMKFIDNIMGHNQNLVSFLQRAIGYSLTGLTTEQALFICYGTGANGKSTMLDILCRVMGSYGAVTPSSTLLAKKADSINNDVARLAGKRFVSSSETDEGRKLAEATIKSLTGGEEVTARYLHAEYFQFTPILKLFLATNHKPQIIGQDKGIWRRVKLIPFSVSIPEERQDKNLPEKLREELPGILNWIIAGCLEWQQQGLNTPHEVLAATGDYRAEMDVLTSFIDEECVIERDAKVAAKELYTHYSKWADDAGEKGESQRKFGQKLTERGFDRVKVGTIFYLGIRIRTEDDPLTPTPEPEEERKSLGGVCGGQLDELDKDSGYHNETTSLNENPINSSSLSIHPEDTYTLEIAKATVFTNALDRFTLQEFVLTPDKRTGTVVDVSQNSVSVSIYGKVTTYDAPHWQQVTPYTQHTSDFL